MTVSAPGLALSTGETVTGDTTFRLKPGAEIVLHVRRTNGEPAGLAVIRSASDIRAPLLMTDERGEAVIGVPTDRPMTFGIETADGASARVLVPVPKLRQDAPEHRVVDVRLAAPTPISGRATETASTVPVPHAAAWVSADPGRSAYTDSFGTFQLTLPPGQDTVELRVAAAGYSTAKASVSIASGQSGDDVLVALTPTAPFEGWIVNHLERPVPGAHIEAQPTDEVALSDSSSSSHRATSRPDGYFRIANARYNRPYRLTVKAESYAPSVHDVPAFERDAVPEPVLVVLTPGRTPSGTVVNLEGKPVAGARVRLLWPPTDPEPARNDQAVTHVPASNRRGEFEIPNVAPGHYRVSISHPEYVEVQSKAAEVTPGDGHLDLGVFTLTPGAEVHGLVTDHNGRHVNGAEVHIKQRKASLDSQSRTVTTRSDGRFRSSGLLLALADITVTAEGYAPSVLESVRPGTGQQILVELAQGAALAGRVLAPGGDPAVGVDVLLSPGASDLSRVAARLPGEQLFRRARSDNDGRFRLDNLISATWSVEAVDGTRRATVEGIALALGEVRDIELQLQTPDQLTVHVTSHLGDPVANAHVRVSPKSPTWSPAIGRTDAGGRANLPVNAGAAMVEVSHPDLLARSREVLLQEGVNQLRVRLDSGWEISGTVRSVDGVPIPGASVEASQDSLDDGAGELDAHVGRLLRAMQLAARVVSDLNGSFRLSGLTRGRYRLVAWLPGHAQSASPKTVEISDDSVSNVQLVLESGATVHGTVTGLDTAEMAAVEVQASQGVLFQTVTPDFDGNFTLEALAPGTWRIVAATRQRRSAEQDVTLEPGSANTTVELRFELGFSLTGQVLVAGEPAIGGLVSVLLPDEKSRRTTRTDHLGRFEIKGLQAGAYVLTARHERGITEEQSVDLQSDYYNLFLNLQPRPDHQN